MKSQVASPRAFLAGTRQRARTGENTWMDSLPSEPDLSEAGWQLRYDDNHTGWDRGEPNPAFLEWLEANALQPRRVFAPGYRRGHGVVELARRGLEATAVDLARAATQTQAERRLDAFSPDERRSKIFSQAAVVGEAMARANSYAKRCEGAKVWEGKQWEKALFISDTDQDWKPTLSWTNEHRGSTRRSA